MFSSVFVSKVAHEGWLGFDLQNRRIITLKRSTQGSKLTQTYISLVTL